MADQNLPTTGKEVRLARYVQTQPTKADFKVVKVPVKKPTSGNVLVHNLYLQVTAVMRDLMTEDPNLPMMPSYKVGERPWGGAVGTVVASESPDLAVGDTVAHMDGWTEYSTGPAGQYHKVDPSWFPGPEYFLNQGITAYHGMADVAEVGDGDVVFVSNAAGGVGSLAGQIAKARGAKYVIGSAGSQEKVEYLIKELGYDAAFDYHDGPVVDRLRELAPDGINVFFDLVGGEQFEAAVQAAAQDARLVLCGAVSAQTGNAEGAFPKLDIMTGIAKQIVIKPFSTYHTPEQIQAWNQHFGQWLQEGKIVLPHTVVKGGVSAAPKALISLLSGAYKGNVLVKISDG